MAAAIGASFLRGLLAILPVVVTVYVVVWLATLIEGAFKGLLVPMLPEGAKLPPGTGILLALLVVFLVGFLTAHRAFNALLGMFEAVLLHIPGIKTLYSATQDFLSFFDSTKKKDFSKVVIVKIGGQEILGFITREAFDGLPQGIGGPDKVAVYLPMSYQLGGYTIMVNREMVTPVDMSLEDAMKFALTGGVSKAPANAPKDAQSEAPKKGGE